MEQTPPIREDQPKPPLPGGNSAQRVVFRFVSAYLTLHILPFPADKFEPFDPIAAAYTNSEATAVSWIAKHFLHLQNDVTRVFNGSGDTTFDYVKSLSILVIAAAVTLIWSAVGSRKTRYTYLHDFLRTYIRFFLAYNLISYGVDKVLPLQFPAPSADRLMTTYGDSSPMSLVWTFMGSSRAYALFTGAFEILGGLLLVLRRTTTLGALIGAGVLANIVMLNFCYDVPVKLYSSHLLLMALFLLFPDLRRLADFLIFNRPTIPKSLLPATEPRWARIPRLLAGLTFAALMVYSIAEGAMGNFQRRYAGPKPPLYGLYEVESFTRNGEEVPPLTTNAARWRSAYFGDYGVLSVRQMDDARLRFSVNVDESAKNINLSMRDDPSAKYSLKYSLPDNDHLLMEGRLMNDSLIVRLKRIDRPNSRLMDRGFHWINESPFNS